MPTATTSTPLTQLQTDAGYLRDYFASLIETIGKLDIDQIANAVRLYREAWAAERMIYTMGNGGSASTASHMVVDMNKGACFTSPKKLRVMCLNDNIPWMLALANDVNYESVFVEPLKNYLRPGDLVVGISGSGNSKNVLKAIEYANDHGAITLGVTGYDGGKLIKIARHNVNIPIHDMQITEDLHLVYNHAMLRALCDGKGY